MHVTTQRQKNIDLSLLQILLSIIMLFNLLSACAKVEEDSEPPSLPIQVSEHALWIGGLDGGVFVDFSNCANLHSCELAIYSHTGREEYKGLMKVVRAFPISGLPRDVAWDAWDGENLYSIDGTLTVE